MPKAQTWHFRKQLVMLSTRRYLLVTLWSFAEKTFVKQSMMLCVFEILLKIGRFEGGVNRTDDLRVNRTWQFWGGGGGGKSYRRFEGKLDMVIWGRDWGEHNPTIKAHLSYAQTQRNFLISHHCKLDTGMHKPKVHPELYHQQMLNQTCCSELPIWQSLWWPGTVLFPR